MEISREYVFAFSVTCRACSWDPKTNVMIHDDGGALLTNFGLTALVLDQQTFLSTCLEDGTIQWTSPELLDQKGRPTRESDCYALGMVIYEVLSGHTPFGTNEPCLILPDVLGYKHPERPRGEGGKLFADAIWDLLGLCWRIVPNERANARDVLECLEGCSAVDAASTDSGWFFVLSQGLSESSLLYNRPADRAQRKGSPGPTTSLEFQWRVDRCLVNAHCLEYVQRCHQADPRLLTNLTCIT